jgi:hypothetical protein
MLRVLFWATPSLVALAIYWPALLAWFQQDDFAWMGLLREVREGESLLRALFRPSQHGTLRPLGERAYFLVLPALFGYESWPMRLLAFGTQCGSLLLTQAITLRVTGSRLAALLAPVVWIANSKLIIGMISNGAYVHVLCGFFLLLALFCAIQKRWKWMWAAFLVGFGAMESMLVFPALATSWCWFYARTDLRKVLLLWPVSAAYYAGHMLWAPKMTDGSYSMHFDLGIAATLTRYWLWIFQPENLPAFTGLPDRTALVSAAIGTALLLAFVVARALQKQWQPLLFLLWFVILLAPVLPLKGHVTDYYLTIPLAAFGMLAGYAASAWRWPVGLWLVLYLGLSIPCAHLGTKWWRDRSLVAGKLVKRVFAVRKANPGKTIVLEGVTDEQFWSAIAHYPFVEHRKTYVFLARGSEAAISRYAESGVKMEEFFLAPDVEKQLREADQLIVFRAN